MLRRLLITAVLALVSPPAHAQQSCSDLFVAKAPFAHELYGRLAQTLEPLELQQRAYTANFRTQGKTAGVGDFSKVTVQELSSSRGRSHQAEIFEKDLYFQKLYAETPLHQLSARKAALMFTDRFNDYRRTTVSTEVALIKIQQQFDANVTESMMEVGDMLSELSDVVDVIKTSEAFKFLSSSESTSFFWKPLTTIDKIQNLRLQVLGAIRNKHSAKLPPAFLAKLTGLTINGDAGVTWLRSFNDTALNNADSNLRFKKFRDSIGAPEHLTARMLKQICDRVSLEEPYEITLLNLFETTEAYAERNRGLSMTREILDLAMALDTIDGFGEYVTNLYYRKEQARTSSR